MFYIWSSNITKLIYQHVAKNKVFSILFTPLTNHFKDSVFRNAKANQIRAYGSYRCVLFGGYWIYESKWLIFPFMVHSCL